LDPAAAQPYSVVSHHNLVVTPFDPSKFTVGHSAYDTPVQGQELYAPEYISDIFQRLYHAEVSELSLLLWLLLFFLAVLVHLCRIR